jgi:AraC-like DNA-binding protein
MKILEFTLPVSDNRSIIVKEERLQHFYPHLHRHHEVQLTWVIDGEGTLVADNSMHSFQSNEIYWIGANQSHVFKSEPSYFENKHGKKTHAIDIFFSPDAQLSSFFELPEAKRLKNFAQQHNSGFRLPQNRVEEISEIMLLVANTSGIEQLVNFINLLKQLSGIDQVAPLSSESNNVKYSDNEGIRIATIYNYIMQHYNEPITLEEVAKLAYMTPQAFCRYFKKHTHHTLVSFINQVRINEACKKLVDNRYESIASVAYNTGFNSITNFNRVFKSVIKKSPKEYIESYFRNVKEAGSLAA